MTSLSRRYEKTNLAIIILLVAGISVANYTLRHNQIGFALIFQPLYFVPVILAAFWFGIRGAISTSAAITILYLPFATSYFRALTAFEIESVLEVLTLNIVAAMIGWLRDRERARQQQLVESERLAAIGRAVSSVAHDMKTPLVAIGGFARLARERFPADDPDREKLGIIIRETQRLEYLVCEMLDYSGSLRLSPAEENLARIIGESLAVVQEIAAGKGVQICGDIDHMLPQLVCDGMRIKQMLINLLTNAIDSSPEGGRVCVKARSANSEMILEVVDSGSGIPRAQRHLIFEPFFTTKSSGTGLGLPVVKKIVEAHLGALQIVENPDRGLTFRIALPMMSKSADEASQSGMQAR